MPDTGPHTTPPESLPEAFRREPALQAITHVGSLITQSFEQELRKGVMTILGARMICALCGAARAKWDRVNAETVQAAIAEHAAAQASLHEGSQPLNVMDFLPDEIKPHPSDPAGDNGHMPQVFPGVTILSGTVYCDWHLADAEEKAAEAGARSPLLAARAGADLGALARVAATGR
ncbi:MAG TPA: hypothetical protein VFQ44_01745 [Streptosporangiaceae bacterium]|nr:hypothetical protein [Streptosporangiaceae bacterium]